MSLPERSPERDAAIVALLPHVASDGWTVSALTKTAGADADLLFPGGPADMVEAYSDLADRWMEADAAAQDMKDLRLPQRVRAVILARFARNEPYKDAVRRGLGVLALPGRAVLAARCTGRTVDSIWHAAGDQSADFSWYTKRAILTAVYGATLLFWLHDHSEDSAATAEFLDRRLQGVARIGSVRRRAAVLLKRE
jgi:ubiquinone biosynthesis protein COQ9